ncbi:MAG: DUF4426 domain-containing protein, partial [Pseudomonadota bacterium]|nr:DUF4426 domain-containing protein [Pseudomonadota bacterium]
MLIRSACYLILSYVLCAVMPLAYAEQSKEVGAYKIHYNAINTSMLQPEIAKSYQIIRSRTRGLL